MTSPPEPDIETAERSPQLIEQAIASWAALTEVSAQRDALQAESASLHQRMESLSADVAVLRKAAQALSAEMVSEKSTEIPLQTSNEDER